MNNRLVAFEAHDYRTTRSVMSFLWTPGDSLRECALRSSTFTVLFVLQVHFGTQVLGLAFSPNSSTTTTTDQPTPTEGAHLCNEETGVNDSGNSPLYFLVMAPYPDSHPLSPSWEGGPAVVPAAIVARDLINKRDDILEDYTIHFLVNDSVENNSQPYPWAILFW